MRMEKYRDDEFADTRSDQREHKPRAERDMRDEARRRVADVAPAIDSGFTPATADAPVDGGCGGE